jgi:hypothetical protein
MDSAEWHPAVGKRNILNNIYQKYLSKAIQLHDKQLHDKAGSRLGLLHHCLRSSPTGIGVILHGLVVVTISYTATCLVTKRKNDADSVRAPKIGV